MYWWSPQLSGRGGASNLTLENGRPISNDKQPAAETLRAKQSEAIIRKAAKITASPVEAPYKYKFSEVGRLTQLARGWVQFLDEAPLSEDTHVLHDAIEGAITTLFPYLRHSPRHSGSRVPFKDLRDAIIPGSRGLVIPTGKTTMRHAAHLIRSLQDVLDTQLRILIVYAGDQDFPPEDRDKMQSRFMNVEFMDILTVVDDSTLQLGDGGWAIKAFAALYAPFEEVILADADCVFVQPPELLYDDPLYIDSGALLFHDRLLWQHAYRERHEWWQSQIQDPSATLNKSLVWTEDYAEEGDSGVVLLNKSRLDVLMGLLHISWQNTKAVRDEVTYKMTHGDKESWWLGLELSGSNYTFERHYGSMVGWPRAGSGKAERSKVCSFYIAHVDAGDALFWYNGGLLVNKRWDPETFGVPTHLMIDGKWHKGGDRKEESCMDGVTALDLPEETIQLLEQSIALAKDVDSELGF